MTTTKCSSKRKRIRITKDERSKLNTEQDIKKEYGEAYQKNAASPNAKLLGEFIEVWKHEFWIDKHYTDRRIFGDENGPREGIEETIVEALIKKSISHLFYYSLKHNFSFINFPPKRILPHRVVLQELSNLTETLNVVSEFHFLDTNKYEVTVKTAMRIENFKIQDNQYVIEFSNNESTLYLATNKKLNKIDDFS